MTSFRAVGSATPSTSTARSVAAPRRVARHPGACVPRPRTLSDDASSSSSSSSSRPSGSVAARSWNPLSVLAPPDISGDLLASVATLVLRGVLRSADDVRFVVDCSAGDLIQGRVDGVTLSGERWVSPLDLSCERIRCVVGAVEIDPIALVTKQRVELRTIPSGTMEVSFDADDFGNFLVHPQFETAVARSRREWGFDLTFRRDGVRLEDGAVVFFVTRGGGGGGGATGGDESERESEFVGEERERGDVVKVRMRPVGRGVVECVVAGSGATSDATSDATSAALERFFRELVVNLLGAELRYGDMAVDEARVTLALTLRVLKFPSSLNGVI